MFEIALALFLVANPLGNSPAIIALIKDFEFHRQKTILIREALIALLLALFFQYFGIIFLKLLNVEGYAVTISGGILLFLVALTIIFAPAPNAAANQPKREPMIVPIATPILSGPGLLAMIMYFSNMYPSTVLTLAILLTWIAILAVLSALPYLQKYLGKSGLVALEQMMGMMLALMSVEMIVKGSAAFAKTMS